MIINYIPLYVQMQKTKLNIMHTIRSAFVISGLLICLLSGCNKESNNQLHYEEAGAGKTVIFVHGSQADYRYHLPQVDALKDNFRVVTYSRRYNYPNGNEYNPNINFSVFTEAEDLNNLIHHLGGEPVHLVGHSYGGLISMAYAVKYPEKVHSLILSEPPAVRLQGCESWYDYVHEEMIGKVKTAFETGDSTRVMSAIFEFFAGADIRDQVPPQVLEVFYANLTEMESMVHSEEPFPDLSTDFDMPVMLITGGNTMPMLDCTNDALVERIPDAVHLHLPEATHSMWMSHTDELNRSLNDFISGTQGSFE
jgi:pimeloyl-ACP methyl ester carboxylesterase